MEPVTQIHAGPYFPTFKLSVSQIWSTYLLEILSYNFLGEL